MATFVKGDKIKPLVVLEEDMVEHEVDGMTAIGISKDKYPNLCEYLYVSFGDMILTRQLGGQDGESGMYSVAYHYPYPKEEGEPSDKTLTYSMSYSIMGVSGDGNYYLCIPAVTTTFVTKSNNEQLSSIELSRAATYEGYELSENIKNNFKQNIGISGGADWNAQQGEAGYIENKPFGKYIQNFHVTGSFTSDESLIPFYDSGNCGDKYPKLYLKGTYLYGDVLFETVLNTIEPWSYEVYEYNGIEFSIETGGGGEEIFLKIDDESGTISAMYGGIDIEFYTVSNYLDDAYLPNTVLKTFPQRLSDTDKNQALANLGIDPVVWKYMCNPHIIEYDSDGGVCYNAIPKELSDIIYQNGKFNHLVLSTVLIKIRSEDNRIVERITAYNENGNVIFDEEEFVYDTETRLFLV